MSFVSLVKWFRWLWLDPLPAYDYCLFEMIAIKSLYIRNTSISFFAKWCQNAIQASVQNCSFIAALTQIRALTHTHKYKYKYINVDKKHQLNFYTNFPLLVYFFWFFETIPMFLRAHESTLGTHTHTHTSIYMYMYILCVCVCVSVFCESKLCQLRSGWKCAKVFLCTSNTVVLF